MNGGLLPSGLCCLFMLFVECTFYLSLSEISLCFLREAKREGVSQLDSFFDSNCKSLKMSKLTGTARLQKGL